MINWFEVSSGAIANAEVAEITLKMTANGRSMAESFTREFRFVTQELWPARVSCQH